MLSLPAQAADSVDCLGGVGLRVGGVSVTVEIADEPAERRRGLMFRDQLGEACGMLFVFDDTAVRTFTMRNVVFGLDVAFLDSTGRVGHIVTMQPGDQRHHSIVPARYALEVNAGWFVRHEVEIGTQLTLTGGQPVAALAPQS